MGFYTGKRVAGVAEGGEQLFRDLCTILLPEIGKLLKLEFKVCQQRDGLLSSLHRQSQLRKKKSLGRKKKPFKTS